jgi:hypothetical protein
MIDHHIVYDVVALTEIRRQGEGGEIIKVHWRIAGKDNMKTRLTQKRGSLMILVYSMGRRVSSYSPSWSTHFWAWPSWRSSTPCLLRGHFASSPSCKSSGACAAARSSEVDETSEGTAYLPDCPRCAILSAWHTHCEQP